MYNIKGAHESRKGNLRTEQGGAKDRVLDGLSMINTFAAHL